MENCFEHRSGYCTEDLTGYCTEAYLEHCIEVEFGTESGTEDCTVVYSEV